MSYIFAAELIHRRSVGLRKNLLDVLFQNMVPHQLDGLLHSEQGLGQGRTHLMNRVLMLVLVQVSE